ncbi:MAG: hypothetical protein HY270_16800 [Deltaproteobacteria bacterium]|nr:hypothetical protein [Deltaproteobacteria bacterium]
MAEPVYDVLLVGFRNDLARARTLKFLDGENHEDISQPLPRLIYAGLARNEAEQVRAELERLGAQVTLRNANQPAMPLTDVAPPASAIAPSLARALSLAAIAAVGVALLLVVSLNLKPQARHPPAPPRRAAKTESHDKEAPIRVPQPPIPEAAPATIVDARAAKLNADALALAQKGDLQAAVENLRRARVIDSEDATLRNNLQTLLVGWATNALNDNDYDDAVNRLDEAATLGESSEVFYGLGVVSLRRDDPEAANAALTRAAALAPKDARIPLALAEAHLKSNQRPEALADLQHARELGVSGGDLDRRIERLGREVDTEWDYVERESAHFQISFADGEDTSIVHTVLGSFEDAYDEVGSKLRQYPGTRTAIVLYTQQDFHSITHTPDWAGGAYDGRIKLPVRGLSAGDEALARVARHEYAHSIVTTLSSGHCPVWLNEGLAVWSEETRDGDHGDWAESKIAERPLIPLAALNRSFSSMGEADAELAYAEGYLAARSIIDRQGVARLRDFLSSVAHQPLEAAFRSAFGEEMSDFQDRLFHDLGAS